MMRKNAFVGVVRVKCGGPHIDNALEFVSTPFEEREDAATWARVVAERKAEEQGFAHSVIHTFTKPVHADHPIKRKENSHA